MEPHADHAAFLNCHSFRVDPAAPLDDSQRRLLERYGHWLKGLAEGVLSPLSPGQERFVRVSRGQAAPQSEFERAWAAHERIVESPADEVDRVDPASCLEEVAVARAEAAAVTREYEARHEAILAPIKARLEALEAEYAPRLQATRDEVTRAEAAARAAVLAHGATVKHAGLQAVWSRPRVTWDSRGLNEYVQTHPELLPFRRVGKPTVSLRVQLPEANARK